MTTRTKEGYLLEQAKTEPVNKLFASLKPAQIQTFRARPINPIPGVTTDYEITFGADAEFYNGYILKIEFPSEITVKNYQGRLLQNRSGRCSDLLRSSNRITCSEISSNTIRIDGLFTTNNKQYGVYI